MAKLIIFRNDYDTLAAMQNVFGYVGNGSKSCGYTGAQNMLINNDIEQVNAVNRYFCNNTKKKVIHFVIAFAQEDYISTEDAFSAGYEVCSLLPEYQIMFSVHQDTDNPHIHFAMNPTSLIDGHKVCFTNSNLFKFITGLREIFKTYEIKISFDFTGSYK